MNLYRDWSVPITVSRKDTLQGIVFMCLSGFFWAMLELSGHVFPSNTNVFQLEWGRFVVHVIFMMVIFAPRHGSKLVRTNRQSLQLLRPLLMVVMPLLFVLSFRYMSFYEVWFGFWVAPLMMVALSVLLGEKVTWIHWLAAVVGIISAFLILRPNHASIGWHIIFPLGMAFCYSLFCILTRALHTESTMTNLFYLGLVFVVPWSFGIPFFWQSLTLNTILAFIAVGLISYGSLYFLDKSYKVCPVSISAPFIYSQLLFTTILSAILVGTVSKGSVVAIFILVSMGLFLVYYEVKRTYIQQSAQMPQLIWVERNKYDS